VERGVALGPGEFQLAVAPPLELGHERREPVVLGAATERLPE